jgi:hypothetical protein
MPVTRRQGETKRSRQRLEASRSAMVQTVRERGKTCAGVALSPSHHIGST